LKILFTISTIVLMFTMLAILPASATQADYLSAAPEDIAWWEEARLGFFICWGPASIQGDEIGWSRAGKRNGDPQWPIYSSVPVHIYDNLYKDFNPTQFDPDEWMQTVKKSGAKYIIFLTKHHDGFALFDSKLTDYKITNTPYKKDVTKMIADACHRAGIKLGFYYSQPDWHHPDYRTERHAEYIKYMHGQMRELLTNYGKVDLVWFDGLHCVKEDWDAENMFKMMRELQPGILINNRCGLKGDFDTPEQRIGRFKDNRPWESCITLGSQWSYKPNDKPKSFRNCIRILATCAGGDGNLALNTGPMPDGRIDPAHVARYLEIGDWLKQYGQCIYGTRGGPYKPGSYGVCTSKGSTVYLHFLQLDRESGKTMFPALPRKILSWKVLTGGKAKVKQSDKGVSISIPQKHWDLNDTIVALQLDGPVAGIEPLDVPSKWITVGKKISASSIYKSSYRADKAVDGLYSTRWGAAQGKHEGWLEVDLGENTSFNKAIIYEAYNRTKEFKLQYQKNGEWKEFASGASIGERLVIEFEPVTARHVRLNITKADDVPTIWEFHLVPCK
jgi:alpha-L-fucosidase